MALLSHHFAVPLYNDVVMQHGSVVHTFFLLRPSFLHVVLRCIYGLNGFIRHEWVREEAIKGIEFRV